VFPVTHSRWLSGDASTKLLVNGLTLEGFITKTATKLSSGFSAEIELTTNIEPFSIKGSKNDSLSEVIFHVFNFGQLITSNVSKEVEGNSQYRIDQLVLEYGDWVCVIKNLTTTSKTIESFKSGTTSGLTQVARLHKKDGQVLSVDEAICKKRLAIDGMNANIEATELERDTMNKK
jgi:hypothetical protein